MAKCTFCGVQLRQGTGTMFVYTSGKIAYFCSMKCEKNTLKLNHKPLTTAWTLEAMNERRKGGNAASAKKKAILQEQQEKAAAKSEKTEDLE